MPQMALADQVRGRHASASCSKLPEAERTELARSLAERAMDPLTKAIEMGYRNLDLIRKDSDLDPLRSREDFRALLDRAEGELAKYE